MHKSNTYKILGLDPGSRLFGWGIISINGNQNSLVEAGFIDLRKEADVSEKLMIISNGIKELINNYKPKSAAIESPFYHQNAQTLIKLTQSRAAALLTLKQCELTVSEYSPREIKKSVTGKGSADKSQVAFMVGRLLNIDIDQLTSDATDALAIAICHYMRGDNTRGIVTGKNRKTNSWSQFVEKNPERVIGA